MIDFTNCRVIPGRAYNGANGSKIAVEYNGEAYMLKFPPSAEGKPTDLSYTNSCISEHIASSIFNMLGIRAQETMLGTYTVKGKEKLVCACKDFTAGGKRLLDFCSIKNTVLDSDSNGSGTELSDVMDAMTQKGELLFYLVSPTNISVLSYVNIEIKIRHLMMVLSSLPDIEITCTDSSECFDDNKAYLHERLEYEQNPKVRKLIKKDIEFLDNVQVEMATARQFLFTARIKASKDKQVFDTANRVEKIISEQGFEVRRMRKADIKRFLALYFEASMNGEQMPDIDGEQFYEVDDDEEDEA